MTDQLDTPIQELDVVALSHNLPEHGLKQGDRGVQALLMITAAHLQKIESFQSTLHPAHNHV